MKKNLIFLLMLFIAGRAFALPPETLPFRSFGKVAVYKPKATPRAMVLIISGDGGWELGVETMAVKMAEQGCLVGGINIRTYYQNIKSQQVKCYYPAADLEALSIALQKKYRITDYMKPILVGYSSGASLAYGALAQAPANTFKGAIGLGFCPDIEIGKPLCAGTGLSSTVQKPGQVYILQPSRKLTAPFIVLHGDQDEVCSIAASQKFMKDMPKGKLILLPKVGHGFSVERNWWPQFMEAFKNIMEAPAFGSIRQPASKLAVLPFRSDLPLTEIPAPGQEQRPLVFAVSGDGGWTSFDEDLGQELAKKGMPVVGLDAQKYFWQSKTPAQTAAEAAQAISHYLSVWNRNAFILMGYSFGADVVPFIAPQLPPELRKKLLGVVCLSPDENASFEIRLGDMLELSSTGTYKVLPAVQRISAFNPVCVFGSQEDAALPKKFAGAGAKIVMLPGNHHYNEDYAAIAASVLENYRKK